MCPSARFAFFETDSGIVSEVRSSSRFCISVMGVCALSIILYEIPNFSWESNCLLCIILLYAIREISIPITNVSSGWNHKVDHNDSTRVETTWCWSIKHSSSLNWAEIKNPGYAPLSLTLCKTISKNIKSSLMWLSKY